MADDSTPTPATGTATTAQPIQFRTEAPVTASDYGFALFVTLALLAATYALLRLAQQRGWKLPLRTVTGTATTIEVVESRRVSLHTTVHLVRVGDRRVLLTESSRNTSAVELVRDDTPGGGA